MTSRPLRIAWIGAGPGPRESGGVPGVATELLLGLTKLGHRIDCYLPGAGTLPERVREAPGLSFHRGAAQWRPNRWYSRTSIGVAASGMWMRGSGSLQLRREIARRHAEHPYDLVYQFSNIEALGMPPAMARTVPLVIHPETHVAGELRYLLAERRLALRCSSRRSLATTAALMAVRVLVQRRRIRAARLLICISAVFREHLLRDYDFPRQDTVVVPNPVRLERFAGCDPGRALGEPATVLVLGRISARKGVEDVIEMARLLRDRGVRARVRVVGGPTLWSDYTPLLAELPPENSEFVGRIEPDVLPQELGRADVLVQASHYEPFGLTVGEALAAGVPVVGTSEVGAIEGVDRGVVAEVTPGDPAALAAGVQELLGRLAADGPRVRSLAQAEARRLFAPATVCGQISAALGTLAGDRERA